MYIKETDESTPDIKSSACGVFMSHDPNNYDPDHTTEMHPKGMISSHTWTKCC